MDTHSLSIPRIITISDDVYRKLVREKGDRSFSEVIDDHLEAGGQLTDVSGQRIFDAGTYERVKDDVETLSRGTLERFEG
jgi:predicted CopG family antitoxin